MKAFLGLLVFAFVIFQIKVFAQNTTSCKDVPHGELLPHPEDCNKFFQCVGWKPVEMKCPKGLHFNAKKKVCDWPQNANCSVNSTTTEVPTTVSTTTTEVPTTVNTTTTEVPTTVNTTTTEVPTTVSTTTTEVPTTVNTTTEVPTTGK